MYQLWISFTGLLALQFVATWLSVGLGQVGYCINWGSGMSYSSQTHSRMSLLIQILRPTFDPDAYDTRTKSIVRVPRNSFHPPVAV